jgi:hypothetical protein
MNPSLGAKQQISELDWKQPTSPVKKKFISQPAVGRALFEICRDQHLSIIRKVMWRWTAYIALRYCMMSCSWRLWVNAKDNQPKMCCPYCWNTPAAMLCD